MRILLFDTETTSLRGYALEIAYILLEKKPNGRFKVVNLAGTALYPDAPVEEAVKEKFFIDESALVGYPRFERFWWRHYRDFLYADLVVAHNIEFDLKVLWREFNRFKKTFFWKPKEAFCTCKDVKRALGFPKFPKLAELVRKLSIGSDRIEETYEKFLRKNPYGYLPSLIRKRPVKYHNALYDTCVLTRVFVELDRMGLTNTLVKAKMKTYER